MMSQRWLLWKHTALTPLQLKKNFHDKDIITRYYFYHSSMSNQPGFYLLYCNQSKLPANIICQAIQLTVFRVRQPPACPVLATLQHPNSPHGLCSCPLCGAAGIKYIREEPPPWCLTNRSAQTMSLSLLHDSASLNKGTKGQLSAQEQEVDMTSHAMERAERHLHLLFLWTSPQQPRSKGTGKP